MDRFMDITKLFIACNGSGEQDIYFLTNKKTGWVHLSAVSIYEIYRDVERVELDRLFPDIKLKHKSKLLRL